MPDCAPPLPVKRSSVPVGADTSSPHSALSTSQSTPDGATAKSGDKGETLPLSGKATEASPMKAAPLRYSADRLSRDDSGSAGLYSQPDGYSCFKPCGNASAALTFAEAVQDAVMDPSKWLLRNRETGQEIEAKAFVEAIMQHAARRPTPQQTPQVVGWMSRLQRNNGPIIRRPTLLPSNDSSGGTSSDDLFPPTSMDPLNPPGLRGSVASRAISSSPMQMRGRSSLPAYYPSLMHNRSSLDARSNSSSTSNNSSSNALGAGNIVNGGNSVFILSKINTIQIVPKLHPGGIRAISFSPLGKFLATAGADHRCVVFRVQGLCQFAPRKDTSPNTSPGTLAVEQNPPKPRNDDADALKNDLSDVNSMGCLIDEEPFRILSGHVGSIESLSWAPDDSVLLTASMDGTVRCWHPQNGGMCSGVYEHGGGVTSVAWDPAAIPEVEGGGAVGRGRFLTGCLDGKLRLFSVGSLEEEESVRVERPVTAVAFAPGGSTFLAGFVGGNVGFYRTEGMAKELTVECRRHGIRHSASQHARHATSPVRRLSASKGGRGGAQTGASGSSNYGIGAGRGGRRRTTMGSDARPGRRLSGVTEERVTGLCFRPQGRRGLTELDGALNWKSDPEMRQGSSENVSGKDIREGVNASPSYTEDKGYLAKNIAPTSSVEEGLMSESANGDANEIDGHAWFRPNILVSTNNSRTRILVSGRDRAVTVGAKLKGHNTDGVPGRHAIARYSDDGELVISGSTDGDIHIWSTPTPVVARGTPRRTVTWAGGREGHERLQVCSKAVAVPVALFAPDSVARSVGVESSRVIVTGDDEGCLKVFVG